MIVSSISIGALKGFNLEYKIKELYPKALLKSFVLYNFPYKTDNRNSNSKMTSDELKC